jgi:hypothetical protein
MRRRDGKWISQWATAIDDDSTDTPAKAAAASDCRRNLQIALLIKN